MMLNIFSSAYLPSVYPLVVCWPFSLGCFFRSCHPLGKRDSVPSGAEKQIVDGHVMMQTDRFVCKQVVICEWWSYMPSSPPGCLPGLRTQAVSADSFSANLTTLSLGLKPLLQVQMTYTSYSYPFPSQPLCNLFTFHFKKKTRVP